jgi:preprotein translocase subunit YajC
MDYQAIGMLTVLALIMGIFIYALMSRSKASNMKPEIEMKEE